jgi:cytochrome P450
MIALADLDLPWLPLEDPDFLRDPFPWFATARAQHPWLARCSAGHIVTQFQAIRDLMRHEDKLRMPHPTVVAIMGASDTRWGRFLSHSIQALNGEEHERQRSILAPAFTPRRANEHRQLMREVVAVQLDEWAPKGGFDFEEFASHFPITVMCRLLGADPAAIPSLRSSLEILGMGGNMDPSFVPRFEESYVVIDGFLTELVAARRAGDHPNSAPDLLDYLLEACGDGGLDDEDLGNLLVFLFIAGYDTSKNILTLIMHVLLERPDDYRRCGEDVAFCRRVVEETLRYHSVATLSRIVDQPFSFRDVKLPKDTLLALPWGAAGRDETAVSDPDRFWPERPDGNRHMAFGAGPHICIGQFIARAQIEEGLHLITQRLLNPRRTGEPGWRTFLGVWGIRGLPISFEAASC